MTDQEKVRAFFDEVEPILKATYAKHGMSDTAMLVVQENGAKGLIGMGSAHPEVVASVLLSAAEYLLEISPEEVEQYSKPFDPSQH